MARILYLSYDGLTDPLGQSQILPYLIGLGDHGHEFFLISFEKENPFRLRRETIQEACDEAGINWIPLTYTKKPPILSTVYDLWRMSKTITRLLKKCKMDLVHVRSYLPAIIALRLKRKYSLPFVFDKRGFWIEERTEGKIWDPNNPILKAVIKYFKVQEKQFFIKADAVVSLTQAAKEALLKGEVFELTQSQKQNLAKKTFVIPCAADHSIFSYVSDEEKRRAKINAGIPPDDPVFVYLGSVGTWYMLDEILMTYAHLLENEPNLWFVIYTGGSEEEIRKHALALGVPQEELRIEFVHREDLREKLSVADFSINYMRPGFSRLATSPVKIGELLAMGVPFIVNGGIGDSEQQINEFNAGIVVSPKPSTVDYNFIVENKHKLFKANRRKIADHAGEIFSLENAINEYLKVYAYALDQ